MLSSSLVLQRQELSRTGQYSHRLWAYILWHHAAISKSRYFCVLPEMCKFYAFLSVLKSASLSKHLFDKRFYSCSQHSSWFSWSWASTASASLLTPEYICSCCCRMCSWSPGQGGRYLPFCQLLARTGDVSKVQPDEMGWSCKPWAGQGGSSVRVLEDLMWSSRTCLCSEPSYTRYKSGKTPRLWLPLYHGRDIG